MRLIQISILTLCLLVGLSCNHTQPITNSTSNSEAVPSVTFDVCDVKRAESGLTTTSYLNATRQQVIRKESLWLDDKPKAKPELLCVSDYDANPLVISQNNPFAEAVYLAYAQHRPLTLSPDIIWLTITQGFAAHVNKNSEKLRDKFVNFEGKKSLNIDRDSYHPQSKDFWAGMLPEFAAQIEENTKTEVMGQVVANFSTTGKIETAAYQMTLMDAMQSYFQFSVSVMCGIPEITLEGTPEDWAALEQKAEALGQYDLQWWTTALKPVLAEFTNASKGNANPKFWADIYKEQSVEINVVCAIETDTYLTGWILQFYPYVDEQRNPWIGKTEKDFMKGKKYSGPTVELNDLPAGQAKAPVLLNNNGQKTMLSFVAGFMGVRQDETTLSLRPEIGWAVIDTKEQPNKEALDLYNKAMNGEKIEAKN